MGLVDSWESPVAPNIILLILHLKRKKYKITQIFLLDILGYFKDLS